MSQLVTSWPVFPFPCHYHSWLRHGQSSPSFVTATAGYVMVSLPFPCQCHSRMRHGQSQLPVLARLEGPGEVMCQHGEARGGPDWAEGKGGKA